MNQLPFMQWRGLLLMLIIAVLLPANTAVVHAQTVTEIIVNSTEDRADADLVDDICDADPGPAVQCTLRAAVMQANVTPGEHIIRLQPVLYRLTIPGANEDQALRGDLDLLGKITIIGTVGGGRNRTIVDASGLNDRVFDARSSKSTLQGLIISGGALPTTTGLSTEFDGGGVRAFGTFTLLDSTIRSNTAARGGGIAIFGGTSTILRSTIMDNSATAGDTGLIADGGGGIFSINNVFTLRDSTVQNNTSARDGGGITLAPEFIPATPMRIERSLIVGNSAQNDGGGVFITGRNEGKALIDNSTISANRSSRFGGGLRAEQLPFDKPMLLRATTIAGNSVPFFNGGGISADFISTVEATNVIFANNLGGNCSVSHFEQSTFNLSSDSLCGFNPSDGSKNNTSAKLGPLAFNGGPTRTHALLEGSPAIDGGVSFAPIAFDQRGAFRFAEFRPGGNRFDIGAFEFNGLGVGSFAFTPTSSSISKSETVTLTLTWTHPTRWRDLNQVDVQLRHEEEMPLWVRFTEGVTETAGISTTNGLALYNSDGSLAGVGMPGELTLLESDLATLDLAQSHVQGSGPDGKEVSLTLAVSLKDAAANRVYTVTLLANSDDGTQQGPNDAGTLAVGPFRLLLPLIVASQ
ncbi:MAG: choice-of-anchor Q domain-containing protein [Caldilineaceae bacterium]